MQECGTCYFIPVCT